MGPSTASNRAFTVWSSAILVLVVGAIAITVLTLKPSQEERTFDVQLSWPHSLSMSEPRPVLAIIEDRGEAPSFSGQATLYALPEAEAGRRGHVDGMMDGEKRIELGQTRIVDGMVEFSIAPLSTWSSLKEKASDYSTVKLVLHVQRGGQDVYIGNDLYVRASEPALALTLDRPLYEPGQTMLMRQGQQGDYKIAVEVDGVTTEAGRAEEASSSLAVAGSRPQVKIYPVGRAHFVQGQLSQAIALVTDERGSPLADQALTVAVPEEPRRSLELHTDAAGRATFEWTPREVGSFAEQVRLEARLPDHPMSMQNIDVPLRATPHYLKVSSPAARAGEAFKFVVEPHQGTLFLMLATERGPFSTQILQPSNEAYEHEVVFPDIARGLSKIVISSRERVLDELPVWVRQETTSEVLVAPEAPGYEPGEIAWVDLSFPVLEKSTDEHPVTFGLLGVDEALYALKERADVPWEILLRQAPELMASILPLLDGLEEEDEVGRQIVTAKFLAELESREFGEGLNLSASAGDDISRIMAERSVEGRGRGLAIFFLLCLYVVLALVWRVTWRTMEFSMITARNAGLSLAVAVAASVGWYVLASTLDFEAVFVLFGLGVTALLFILGVTIPNRSNLPAFFWLLACVGVIVLVGCSAFLLDEYHRTLHLDEGWMMIGLLIIPIGSIIFTAGAWVFILMANDEPMPASIIAGLVGPVAFVLLLIPLFGNTVEERFEAANTHVTDNVSFGEAVVAESAPSPPPPPSTRPESGDPIFELMDRRPRRSRTGGLEVISRQRQERSAPSPEARKMAPAARGAGGFDGIDAIVGSSHRAAPAEEAEPAEPAHDRAPAPEGTVRSWFPETMVWMPELDSDEDGNLRVSFPVPDSMTSWRLDAYAHSRDGRFGQGQAGLLVTRHFFVELDLPTHLTDGDRIEVPATLVNNTDEVLKVRVEATTEGALKVEPLDRQQIEVAPRNRHVFTLSIRAEGVGKGELTVSAYGEESRLLDGERREATIAPHGRTISDTISGIILEGARQEFIIPDEAIVNTPAVDVTILPGKVSDALDGLEGMLRKPHGCFEQTSSINYPNTLVLQVLEQTDPGLWPGGAETWKEADEKARSLLHLGYQRMLTFQDHEGAFALYPRARPEILLTAYGVVQLLDMSKVHNVDEKVVLRSVEWLARRQAHNGSWSPDGHRRYSRGVDDTIRTTALVSLGMLRATSAPYYGPATDKALDYLERQLPSITSDHTLALVANALLLGKREDAAKRAMDRLAERVVGADKLGYLDETGRTWMGGHGQYARVETTAMAANAFLIAGVQQPLWEPMLNYIAANRASWGGWGTTQATVWSLTAMQQMRPAPGRTEILVRLGGQPMAHAQGDARPGQMIIDSEIALMQTFREDGVSTGSNMMTIASTDTTPAMYRATAEYAVPWSSPLAADKSGIVVSLDVPDRRMMIHTNQTLTAHLKNTGASRMDTLIVELPLPPGAFVSRDQFEELVEKGAIDHFEILPTHVRIYLAGINPQQTLTLEYTFASMLRGEMVLPPLRAYQFYTPRPLFEIDGGGVVVP
ncbi:MAG: alpha-2-macroglobulin family protein [Bradymonadaceae bacterium]